VTTNLEIQASATVQDLLACLKTIGHFGVAGNLDPDLIARIRVVVEELFSNTIKYGYLGECDREVRLSLTTTPITVLRYEDDAPPFDPTRWERPVEEGSGAPDPHREGEAGIALVLGLATAVAYEPMIGGNRLVLTFAPR